MLSGKELTKTYGARLALNKVSITLQPGQVCGLLGRNGAGKTTLFRILCGLVKPDSGSITVNSNRLKPVGGIIERPGLYPYLNAFDNIRIFAGMPGTKLSREITEQTLIKVGLPLDRTDPVRNFSLGMKQRLGIGIALLGQPEYLVLDEPFSGLDPIGVAALIELITRLAVQENMAILLSSHLMAELTKCCHYLYVMDNGQIVRAAPTEQLIQENVSHYSLSGPGLSSSEVLKRYDIKWGLNDVRVGCRPADMPKLLNDLFQEGTLVTSCTPELSLEQLVNNDAI
ncbi:ABC transporter ATP-binding protein [Mucilaginibacter sp. Bleaf8]|uniref:ABC transporter ATP-binding protein n=1 Tax=Mucilaginibacter sp. Bleaf8 TaxID=2834430 RepID=UPI001BCC5E7D|nr:ABC transporter ATP-binding protein [Mucilaginibacter sp. Bleaf8]MBS7566766.1 ABC transporter ATP-binding protein [Mucilaginibacter sp. Bleaf8]